MDVISLEDKYILEYIKNVLYELKKAVIMVDNARYHHNRSYNSGPIVCKYGILTTLDLKKYGIKKYSDTLLEVMNDIESHANGIDKVSLAVVGLSDIYSSEDVYNPYIPDKIDFLISSDIRVSRFSVNYGNEFLCKGSISIDKIKAIDIRLLKLIESVDELKKTGHYSTMDIIDRYNNLRNIALAMKNSNLDIPLREMSYQECYSLDVDKLAQIPKLVLK